MPSSALGAGGASGPFASDHPRLVHDPAASVVMLADMVVRMVQRYKAQDWLAVRRGMKGLKFIKDETGSTSLGIRGRFYEALSNTGVADRESFAKQRVDVIRYPGARALYDAIRHTA
jgi:hypothetical protein